MNNHSNHGKVYKVKSLEEARKIQFSTEKLEIESLVKIGFIAIWVLIANCLLDILKFLLFKKWGYAKRQFKNIVVYTVGIVGDNVVMLPALAALRSRYQEAMISVITNCQIWDQEGAIGILRPSPFKDRLIVIDDHPVQRERFRFLMDHNKFEGVKCDLFVNLSPFGNRGWIGAVVREMIFAKKLGARYAVGFRMSTYSRRGIFNKVQYRFVKNEPRRSQEVLRELGLKPVENEDFLTCDPLAKDSILEKIKQDGGYAHPLFIINPGAKFEAKCWPVDRFSEVSNWVVKHYDASIVITGIAAEVSIANKIVKALGGVAINLAGKTTIQELVELLRIAKGCVTNDTGTMHIAAMVGTPTVGIFSGRYSPLHWLPLDGNVVSTFSDVECVHCYKEFCGKPQCLETIKVEDVLEAVNEVTNLAQDGLITKRVADEPQRINK